jgi:hypothetical protein
VISRSWDSEKPARIISLRRVLAVAASVAILIVAIGFWQVQQNYSNEALAANFYDDTNSTTRAIEGDESVLNEALSAYQDTDYAKAITLLNNIPDTNTYYLDAQFLLAQSHYQLNDIEAAKTVAGRLQNSGMNSTREQSDWLLLMIYLKEGEQGKKPFQNLLQSILDNPSHTYYPKARQLQKKLDSFWGRIVNQL